MSCRNVFVVVSDLTTSFDSVVLCLVGPLSDQLDDAAFFREVLDKFLAIIHIGSQHGFGEGVKLSVELGKLVVD